MTDENLISACIPRLEADEGFELRAYPDPLTHAEPWTIGCGHTGPEVHDGLVWTPEQCAQALEADIRIAIGSLDRKLPWWRDLSFVRQEAMVNMCFNLGINRLLGFRGALGAMQRGDFAQAADEMMDSLWARQVGPRAKRLAAMMEAGA